MSLSSSKLHLFNLFVKVCPPSRGQSVKVWLLRWAGASVGDNVSIFSPKILGNFNLIIGNNCWIGHDAMIWGPKNSNIVFEDNTKIASRAIIVSGFHEYGLEFDNIAGPGKSADIRIKKGALIDTQAMICPGKTVGEKSHVAAYSVVTHDVPPYVRVAGIPARIIKEFI